ncbi:MAG: BrnA antitoxin family protein [Proteobacteria bacterium]|nr:BrnA antitoxin family protein [Pseudomonadota bacterium]MBU1687119.1 BrnA antitoxin family protein [Pseudomonadota bacterium]
MKAKDFDKTFEKGADITAHLDLDKARRPEQIAKRINIDFPAWVVQRVDKEAIRLGVSRQALLKIWLAEKVEGKAT